MPQLVKGGKQTYGWSWVAQTGRIRIPPEAILDYRFKDTQALVIVPGSRTSGGFCVGSKDSLEGSPIGAMLDRVSELIDCQVEEGRPIEGEGRLLCWTRLRNGVVQLPLETLARYDIKVNDQLLVVKGSGLALAFIVRGPIVEQAREHRELDELIAQ